MLINFAAITHVKSQHVLYIGDHVTLKNGYNTGQSESIGERTDCSYYLDMISSLTELPDITDVTDNSQWYQSYNALRSESYRDNEYCGEISQW